MIKLPKLTADIFNRSDCPEWAKWAAVDRSGECFVYSRKPIEREDVWCYERGNFCYIGDYDASDWRNSLIKRPISYTDINDVRSESDSDMYHEALEKDTNSTEDDVAVPPELKRVFSKKHKQTASIYVGSERKKDDDVKHPNHYTNTPFGLEVIDITKYYDFCIGNALKYIFRHGKKVYDGLTIKESAIKDLSKAIESLHNEIEYIRENWEV